jgi:hypothetical protein
MPVYRLYYWSPKQHCLLPHDIVAEGASRDAFLEHLENVGRHALRLSGTSPSGEAASVPPRIAEARDLIGQAMRLLDEISRQLPPARDNRERLHLRYRG